MGFASSGLAGLAGLRRRRDPEVPLARAAMRGRDPRALSFLPPGGSLQSAADYSGLMFEAAGPFWPCVTSKETFWPSFSDL